jgi:hypothetical protein
MIYIYLHYNFMLHCHRDKIFKIINFRKMKKIFFKNIFCHRDKKNI